MNPHRVSKGEAQQRAKDVIAGSWTTRLPTLAEMRAKPRAIPKFTTDHAVAVVKSPVLAKLKRAKAKQRKTGTDRKKIYKWGQLVKKRDEWVDRYDGRPVLKSAELHPRRAEAHHIVPRGFKETRYDVRNGICLSLETHAKVETGQLEIIGTKFFTVAGRLCIDATHPVKFKETKQS